jgi:hypothetical protein
MFKQIRNQRVLNCHWKSEHKVKFGLVFSFIYFYSLKKNFFAACKRSGGQKCGVSEVCLKKWTKREKINSKVAHHFKLNFRGDWKIKLNQKFQLCTFLFKCLEYFRSHLLNVKLANFASIHYPVSGF